MDLGHLGYMVPERDFAVIVLTNCGPSGHQLNNEIVDWALKTYLDVVPLEPETSAGGYSTSGDSRRA
jgi:hypothetical protein